MAQSYGIDDITHLETREAFRTRIQTYLGSDDTEGIYQALKEIINNSTDEALAGYGNLIEILLDEEKNLIEVRDYGRGVPFGIKGDRNILVAIYTESHTGGKFNKNAYKNSSGLNGIGGTAVNMSSESFFVQSFRDGISAYAKFNTGILEEYKEVETEEKNGTIVRFIPDKEVFKNITELYSYERICKEVKNISYLNKGIRFIVSTTSGKKTEFYSENGIADFIKDNVKKPLMSKPIIVSNKDETDELEIAFMWTNDTAKSYVFVNGLYCPMGGSPVTGAKSAVTTNMKKYIGNKDISTDLIHKGLVYVINCKVAEPSFEAQTKSKINNLNLRTLASQAFKEGLEIFHNTPEFSAIAEMIKKMAKAEKAADAAREAVMNQQKKMTELRKQKVAFIKKLTDAEKLGQDSILCIVEGDSAGNSVAEGRDSKEYGIMRIMGKMKNGLKEQDDKKFFENKEVELLMYALGIDPNRYDPKKLRYGKLGVCVDADDDGHHIFLLIMANIYKICPKFVEENRIYWLRSPLYIEYDKKENPINCFYTEEEFDAARSTIKGTVKRVKGLGQLNDKDLKFSMFSKEHQRLDRILYSKEGMEKLCELMGVDIQPRKDFIFSKIDFSKYSA